MSQVRVSAHAKRRMDQRGLRMHDVDIIERFGTECEDGLYFGVRDAEAARQILKRDLNRLDHLVDTRLILGRQAKTVIRRTSKKQRRAMLRRTL